MFTDEIFPDTMPTYHTIPDTLLPCSMCWRYMYPCLHRQSQTPLFPIACVGGILAYISHNPRHPSSMQHVLEVHCISAYIDNPRHLCSMQHVSEVLLPTYQTIPDTFVPCSMCLGYPYLHVRQSQTALFHAACVAGIPTSVAFLCYHPETHRVNQ